MRPLRDLKIQPGLYTISTDRGANGRWKDGDKVRFHKGLPEKIGGWQKTSTNTFRGSCRGLTDWLSLAFEKFIGAGTHLKLYSWKGGQFYDITPIRSTAVLANPFTTTNGSTTVKVTHASHGALASDFVTYSGAAAVGGITIDGEYQIATIIDVDNYNITHSIAASAGAVGGGAAVTAAYQINTGSDNSLYGLGWGAGAYGQSTWNTPRVVANFFAYARVWSLDQWGEDLIACPRGKAIYVWDTSVGVVANRATLIAGAPSSAKAILVSPENKHLVALGAHNGVADDPMLIKWCSSEDYTAWTASPSNSAGQKRLNTGNEILCGVKAAKEILVFTDSHLWTMTFTGPTSWFSFRNVGQNGSLRGPNAAVEMDGLVFWMGERDFFYYDGRVNLLECDVWPTVFGNSNFVQRYKTYAAVNRRFGEIWWFYCSASASEVDRYVMFNRYEKTWSFGTLARTAMIGDSDIFLVPFATSTDGYLYDHETGTDDSAGAMTAYIQSGDIEIADGDNMMQVGTVVPDFKTLTGSVALTFTAKKYPQDSDSQSEAAITVTSSTKYINPRIKGRQISLRVTSSALSDHWRMGTMRIGVRPHGKK